MEPFENPDHLPLEELKLKVKTDGVTEVISALHKKWTQERYFLHYESPKLHNADGSEIIGARERWMELVGYLIDDFEWLLGLPFYRFWSNVVYNKSILDALVSFLQEAPPFYALEKFPSVPGMLDLLETLCKDVLIVFARLVTNKESPTEYMNQRYLGKLLYDNYIFTVPIIFDLCQLYGRENGKIVERILSSLFTLEPMYAQDLRNAIPKLIEAFEYTERRFEDVPGASTNLPVSLAMQGPGQGEMSLPQLEDTITYILDISSNITILLKNYSPTVNIFHREDFMNKILSLYDNTIPHMYRKLDKLAYNDDYMPEYVELKHKLDVARIEMINLFRTILYGPILDIETNVSKMSESVIKERVDDYINLLSNAISEQEFITDYNQIYPVIYDLNILSNICPELDTIKCDYVMQSLCATIGELSIPETNFYNDTSQAEAGPSNIQENQPGPSTSQVDGGKVEEGSPVKDSVKLASLISEVKDILCDLGEGFIQMCLKHYNYDSASVINAVLEDSLPVNLKEIDPKLPFIPADPMEKSAEVDLALGVQRLNVFDNDEFDIMTRDEIDMSRVYDGKKKEKYKNLNEMLDDKSDIKKMSEIYQKYSIITDDYNDEYDDTYDSHDVCGATQDGPIEAESRVFPNSRVATKQKQEILSEKESESSEEDNTVGQNGKRNFLQNPETFRRRVEQRRQQLAAQQGGKSSNTVGKSKNQGQEKEVKVNRDHKTANKAMRGNHNRRTGAQWKRNQGMIPF